MRADSPQTDHPQLLVSVRSAEEARAAIAGGCDVLDVKEPSRGPMGMADVDTIAEISESIREMPGGDSIPVSAALGEAADWLASDSAPALPDGLSYVKMGPAGLADCTDWQNDWQNIRFQFDVRSRSRQQWIAVCYADWQAANAPQPVDIIRAAASGECVGVLIDTFRKSSQSLFDHLPIAELESIAQQVRQQDMKLALAGSLRIEHLPLLSAIRPDIIAVRGAACRNGSRVDQIDAGAIHALRSEMTRVFPPADLPARTA